MQKTMPPQTSSHAIALPAESNGAPPEWIEILPLGTFDGRDGRGPFRANAQKILAGTRALQMSAGLPIDWDHDTDLANDSRAAGWMREFKADGDVLMTRVEWTQKGAASVVSREYRYISPVYQFKADNPDAPAAKQSGEITAILRAGLTNNPNLVLTAINSANRPTERSMQPKLSEFELGVCRDLGLTQAEFTAQKAKEVAVEARALVREDRGLQNRYRGLKLSSNPGLNREEAVTCLMMNISPADFIRTRDAGISINGTGGIKGRQVLDESLSQPPKNKDGNPAYGEGPEDSIASLVASAMEALKSFSANPKDPDGWMVLAQAARCLIYAIDQCAPPFADRPGAGSDRADA
jgi:hypothetical protein